jgi:hypothetical protein
MSTSTQKPLSIAEVVELPVSREDEPTWVNEFTGVVRAIQEKKVRTSGKAMWINRIGDTTGSAEITMSLFAPPRFAIGDVIVVEGKGMRRTEYEGNAQVTPSSKSQPNINVIGQSAHHEEQAQRKSESAPAVNGQTFPVAGQTVGMSMNNALTLLTSKLTHDEMIARIITPTFWHSVHEVASDIIRCSRLLEAGKLAPSVKERAGGASAARPEPAPQPARPAQPPPAAPRKGPTDEQLANRTDHGIDEDVPF